MNTNFIIHDFLFDIRYSVCFTSYIFRLMSILLGVHCSVAGGLENAFTEAAAKNIDTFQIFTRNQRQWKAKPISEEEKKKFSESWKKSKVKTIFSHCSYLLNLGNVNSEIHQKTITALTEEVIRCTILGLKFCVLHPGAAGEQT